MLSNNLSLDEEDDVQKELLALQEEIVMAFHTSNVTALTMQYRRRSSVTRSKYPRYPMLHLQQRKKVRCVVCMFTMS